jgi:hypothetical protein
MTVPQSHAPAPPTLVAWTPYTERPILTVGGKMQITNSARVLTHKWPHTAFVTLTVATITHVFLTLSYFAGAGHDDFWISLWSGENLARHGMMLNYNFEPVEIGSSALHVIAIALFELVAPGNALLLNKLTGLLAGVATLVLIYAQRDRLFGGLREQWRTPALCMTSIALATHPSWLNWNLGGLETPYQSFALTCYFIALLHRLRGGGARPLIAVQCIYALLRPEGFLLVALTVTVLLAAHLLNPRTQLATGIPATVMAPLALIVAITGLRYLLFGLLAPAPAYAKSGALGDLLADIPMGLIYLTDYHRSSPMTILQCVLLLAAFGCCVRTLIAHPTQTPDRQVMAIGLLLIGWNHLYVVLVRGDWMTYFRFVAPVIPTICIVMALTVAHLLQRTPITPLISTLLIALTSVLNLWQNPLSYVQTPVASLRSEPLALLTPSDTPLQQRLLELNVSYLRETQDTLPFIRDELPGLYDRLNTKRLVIATYQFGYLPYTVRKTHPELDIEFIDTLGLASPEIARFPMRKTVWGIADGEKLDRIVAGELPPLSGYLHEKSANVLYFMAIEPDQRDRLEQHGWSVLWDRPNAIVYGRRQP